MGWIACLLALAVPGRLPAGQARKEAAVECRAFETDGDTVAAFDFGDEKTAQACRVKPVQRPYGTVARIERAVSLRIPPFSFGPEEDWTVELFVKPPAVKTHANLLQVDKHFNVAVNASLSLVELAYTRADGDRTYPGRITFTDVPLSAKSMNLLALTHSREGEFRLIVNGVPTAPRKAEGYGGSGEAKAVVIGGHRWMCVDFRGEVGPLRISRCVRSFPAARRPPGPVPADAAERLRKFDRIVKAERAGNRAADRLKELETLTDDARRAVADGNGLRAERMLMLADLVSRLVTSGEAAYRQAIRDSVRKEPATEGVVIRMSWEPYTVALADEGMRWAERLGANEIGIHGLERFRPGDLKRWKAAGYRTFALTNPLAMAGNGGARLPPDQRQFEYRLARAVAEGDTVALAVSGADESASPRDYWLVRDLATGRRLKPDEWTFDADLGELAIRNAEAGHEYEARYFVLGKMGNPLHPDFQRLCLKSFERELGPFKGLIDSVWLEGTAFRWFGPTAYGWDWDDFMGTAAPYNQKLFADETGKAFDPLWVIPDTIAINSLFPDEGYTWMSWIHGRLTPWFKAVAEACHGLGMKAWQYWGDYHVGTAPCLGTLKEAGYDQVDHEASEPVTARCLVDLPGGLETFIRPDWMTYTKTERMPLDNPEFDQWRQVKRGLLARFPRGIYWAPWFYAVNGVDAATADFHAERVAEINDEFRFLGGHLRGAPMFTHPLTVAVVSAWGQWHAWHPWGSAAMLHLTDLPVNVRFLSFQEVAGGNVLGDVDVVFMFGTLNTAWSGGRFWEDPALPKAMRDFVNRGGGFVLLQAASYNPRRGDFELADVAGVSIVREEANLRKTLTDASLAADDDAGVEVTKRGAEGTLEPREPFPWFQPVRDVGDSIQTRAAPGARVAYDFKGKPAATCPGVVFNSCGKGRSVYINGVSDDFAMSRLIRYGVFWAAGKEALLDALDVSGAADVFIYAYPERSLLAVLNAGHEAASVTVRCAPSILHLAGKEIAVEDVATGKTVYRGASEGLKAGIPVALPPNCTMLLRRR